MSNKDKIALGHVQQIKVKFIEDRGGVITRIDDKNTVFIERDGVTQTIDIYGRVEVVKL